MDNITIGFLLELIFQNNKENNEDDVIEATPEVAESFFRG